MTNLVSHLSTSITNRKVTPQSRAIPGRELEMIKNDAGGFGFKVDCWSALDRFLIIGTEGGTYSVSAGVVLTRSLVHIDTCIRTDWKRTVDRAVEVSVRALSAKNDYALLVIAKVASHNNKEARKYALSKLNEVCRIGTHLFHFMHFIQGMRGNGRLLKNALQRWYTTKDAEKLAYQVIKYKARDGWSHRDILRLARPKPVSEAQDAVLHYAVKGNLRGDTPSIITASEMALLNPSDTSFICSLIRKYGLTWEMLPSECLKSTEVWTTLVEGSLPLGALLRNLGRLSSLGLTREGSGHGTNAMTSQLQKIGMLETKASTLDTILGRLNDAEELKRSKLHPIQILTAYRTYAQGRGVNGGMSWSVNKQILEALDKMFENSFENIVPTGKRFLVALDVSGSMSMYAAGNTVLKGVDVGATIALQIAKREQNSYIMGFSKEFKNLNILRTDSLGVATKKALDNNFGRTDCALPMVWAKEKGLKVDCFVVITDNDTWYGRIHPNQALKEYRKASGIDAKMIVLATMNTNVTIADPQDSGMLDISGFSPDVIKTISWFASGKLEVADSEDSFE